MPFSQSFPPNPPTISTDTLSVSVYLNNPTRVHRVINDLTLNRFIADRLFASGPKAEGGAVIFDQVTIGDFFLARDVQKIKPGMEYPTLTDTMPTPKVAAVDKWGGQVFITDEQRDRNAIDVFARETRKLANTIVRKVDGIAIATLAAAPINTFTGASWATASGDTMIANLIDAASLINDPDMGYVADLVLLNPIQFNWLLKNNNFRLAMQAFTAKSILRDGIVGDFLGMSFGRSNRVPAGTAYIAASQMVGAISDEVPLSTGVYREEGEDKTYLKSARRLVAYVTDPKAAVQLSGLT
jgi:hypothetical protein